MSHTFKLPSNNPESPVHRNQTSASRQRSCTGFCISVVGLLLTGFCQLAYSQQDWSDTAIYTNPQTNATTSVLNNANNDPFARPIEATVQSGNLAASLNGPIGPAETPTSAAARPAPSSPTSGSNTEAVDPKTIADKLGGKTDGALKDVRSKLSRAVFENDREAQINLATQYLLPIVVIFLVMFIASRIGNYLRDIVTRTVSSQVDETLGRFAGTLVKTAIMTIALISVLSSYDVETTSFAALVAAIGFALGMALQGTLGNFASGIALLVFRPFNVGDYIIVADEEGIVREVALFTTAIDTLDNRHIIIPNDSVFGSKIENWSHNEERRVDVLVGVSYSADMKQTRQVLMNAMSSIEGVISERGPQIYLEELNSSSVDWSCRVWCRPADYLAVKERVMEAAKNALDEQGIGIPFPQLDLHVVTSAQQKLAA